MNTSEDYLVGMSARANASGRRRRAGAFVTAAALVSLWSSAATAEQFVVLDSTWEHTPALPDSHYRVAPLPGSPSNWRSPIDYASGTAHVHLEVNTKPTDTPTKFQVCFEATPTYSCTNQSPTYTTTGVIDWATPFANFYTPPNMEVDWTKGTVKVAVILKDTMNGKPSEDNVGAEKAALYTPTQVRMVVTIVAPGSEYIPPEPADAGAPDSGSEDAGPDASTEMDAGTAAGGGGSNQGAGGSGGSPEPKPSPVNNESGCSVAKAPGNLGSAPHAAWLFVAAAGALLSRGRRRS